MKIFIAFCFIAMVSADLHPFSAEMVNKINQASSTWEAHQHFTEDEFDDVKLKMGAILEGKFKLPEVNLSSHFSGLNSEIPDEFDSRKQWPNCESIISDVRDQANCGSCWAFAAVTAMSDRLCIASNGQKKVRLSADDLLSCCNMFSSFSFCGFGCNGGFPGKAWNYWVKKGIVSGGNWDDSQEEGGCRPYEIEPCGKNNKKHPEHKCSGTAGTPKCSRKCVNGANYKKDLTFGKSSYSLRGEENIQKEIMTYGSVETAFTVMSDFPQYKSGIYQATSSAALGGHAVRIIGWGKENNVPYWLVVNSWGKIWGENGYFRILRGSNHCGFESAVSAGLAKV